MLKKNENLLYIQSISGNKKVDFSELEPYFKQNPNPKILGLPLSLYIYNFGSLFLDTSKVSKRIQTKTIYYDNKINLAENDSGKIVKIEKRKLKKLSKLDNRIKKGNWLMRSLGTSPVIFDTLLAKQTIKQFRLYLLSKGFFDSKVTIRIDTVAKSIWARYIIVENKQYLIDNLTYSITDGAIKRIVNENYEYKIIKKNEPFDQQKMALERNRLEILLKNNGYYDFTKKYISFQVDTTDKKLDVITFIDNPSEYTMHKVYTIKKINMDIDQNDIDSTETFTKTLNGVFYKYSEKKYSTKVLDSKLEIRLNDKFNFTKSQNTQRNLNQLDMFKFVNISYTKDTVENELIATISANSSNKYQVSDELGFTVSQGIPGPFGSLTFANRNVLKGCEIFDIGIRGGIEGVLSASSASQVNAYSSKEFGVNTALSIPRLLFFGKLNNVFINNNPRTRFSLGYNLILRPEYDRSNLRFAATYTLQKGNFQQISFSFLDINYIDSQRIQGENNPSDTNQFYYYLFTKLASQGNTLYRSFRNSINTDIFFIYNYNSYQMGQNKEGSFFRFYFEPGGTTLNFLSFNQIDEIKKSLNLTTVYAYIKANLDMRKYVPVSKHSMFVGRLNIGVANPYGGDKTMPYEKYFFTGGTTSNRAWLPRRLGPGESADYNLLPDGSPNTSSINYRFEKPGLILLEMNAEYRFKIIKFLHGAVFVDAGNIWNINAPDTKQNISDKFYQQIAIGGGYGIRFDFSFLVVRLDIGVKVWDPGRQLSERLVIKNIKSNELFNPFGGQENIIWNIAIGYPF